MKETIKMESRNEEKEKETDKGTKKEGRKESRYKEVEGRRKQNRKNGMEIEMNNERSHQIGVKERREEKKQLRKKYRQTGRSGKEGTKFLSVSFYLCTRFKSLGTLILRPGSGKRFPIFVERTVRHSYIYVSSEVIRFQTEISATAPVVVTDFSWLSSVTRSDYLKKSK
jgi:hypothetical protein